jgi:phosphoribosylformylglycinamidine synthase
VPNRALTDEAPVYHRPFAEPRRRRVASDSAAVAGGAARPADAFVRLLESPTIASKRWIYHQYDHMVRTNTIAPAGATAGVVRSRARRARSRCRSTATAGLSRSIRVRARSWRWPKRAQRRLRRSVPIGATNCLNFGNPERPDIMWQFAEAVAGLGEACRALEIPITAAMSVSTTRPTGAPFCHAGHRRGRRD